MIIEPQSPNRPFLTVKFNAVPDYAPERPPYIRMLAEDMSAKITPLPNGKLHIINEGYVDPGGSGLPIWLVNHIQRRTPYANMLGRKRVISKCAASDSPITFKYKE